MIPSAAITGEPAPRALHVMHIVFRFDFGGLENGLVNLINTMNSGVAHHTVLALTEATGIAERINKADARVISLGKRPGTDLPAYYRLFKLIRALRPDVVHTRNIGALDCQLIAWIAGVPVRVHGEHGWDVHDPHGRSARYRWMRRVVFPFVHRIVALSRELEDWLYRSIHAPRHKVVRICNGVDCRRFVPPHKAVAREEICFGSVTRFAPIKDPLNVLEAFKRLRELRPDKTHSAKLLMVGGGELLDEAKDFIRRHALDDCVMLTGESADVAPLLARMDVYVQGSRREGISNTVLEAMAMGLPVVATRVGGNPELIEDGATGELVPPEDSHQLAVALAQYLDDPSRVKRHGTKGRARVEADFSLETMTRSYASMYTSLARSRGLLAG